MYSDIMELIIYRHQVETIGNENKKKTMQNGRDKTRTKFPVFTFCSFIQYYLIDVVAVFVALIWISVSIVRRIIKFVAKTKMLNEILKPVQMKDKLC